MSALELIQLTRQLEEAEKRIAVLESALRNILAKIDKEYAGDGYALLDTESYAAIQEARRALAPATTQAGE